MCMMSYDEDYDPTLYRSQTRATRRRRECGECGRSIAVGERYQNSFGVWARGSATHTTCEHCWVAVEWLAENCRSYSHGNIWSDFDGHITYMPFSLSRLSVGARRKWRRFDGAGLMAVPGLPPALEANHDR